jgi:phage terminase large subunit
MTQCSSSPIAASDSRRLGRTEAGFECATPIKNSGAGAAMMRIEAVRRILPRCWFNETTTEAGRDALGYYHERRDESRNVGLGPDHSWASNSADAFGYMAIAYEEPPGEGRQDQAAARADAARESLGGLT